MPPVCEKHLVSFFLYDDQVYVPTRSDYGAGSLSNLNIDVVVKVFLMIQLPCNLPCKSVDFD